MLVTSVQQTEPEYSKNLKRIYFPGLSWDTSLTYQRQEFFKEYCDGFLRVFFVVVLVLKRKYYDSLAFWSKKLK